MKYAIKVSVSENGYRAVMEQVSSGFEVDSVECKHLGELREYLSKWDDDGSTQVVVSPADMLKIFLPDGNYDAQAPVVVPEDDIDVGDEIARKLAVNLAVTGQSKEQDSQTP